MSTQLLKTTERLTTIQYQCNKCVGIQNIASGAATKSVGVQNVATHSYCYLHLLYIFSMYVIQEIFLLYHLPYAISTLPYFVSPNCLWANWGAPLEPNCC